MADYESSIGISIDASNALAAIRSLQSQISAFHQSIRNSGNAVNQSVSDNLAKNLLNSVNATKKFSASLTTVSDEAESFTNSLERNKLSLGQYFKYGAASSKNFSKVFTKEFNTIEKVARERVKTIQTQYINMGRTASGSLEAIKVRPLRLDMEALGTQVSMTAQKQQIFNQIVKQGSTNLLNFGKNTQWAGRQLMVGFSIPLSMLGGIAVKSFMEIEKQAIRFKRVYGDTFTPSGETDKMIAQLQTLAGEFTKYGIAISDTMGLAADAAAMGKQNADLIAQVTEATKLAVLGEVDQQKALDTTISISNAFGIAAEDLAGKINFLNSVENQTVTSIEDLTIAIPKAGPVIKQLGGSVEDLAYFLTAMKEGGINASEGANALKSGLASIINPTKQSSEMLAGLGVNINGIVEANAGDVKSTMLGIAQALDKLDPLNRARAIEQLFGKFQFARISTLFENITKEGTQAQRVLDISRQTAAELEILSQRELKSMEDSPMFKFQKALEDIQKSLVPLGEQFLKLLTPVIEFGTQMLEKFNKMDEGAKTFITNIVGFFGLIAPAALMAFGLVANGVANFIKGLNFVRLMFGKLAGAGTGLNQMTQYMTQENLEATAAATSLGGAHSALTTVFTSEKAALDGLISSYDAAALAMQRFNVAPQSRVRTGPGAGKGKQAKGYANGVVSVPGPKGAGDIIPAMLSPGEAVIPADKAQKYGALINGMIADNIPGFNGGYVYDPNDRLVETHLQSSSPLTPGPGYNPNLVSSLQKSRPGVANMAPDVAANIQVYGDMVAMLPAKLNENLKREAGVAIEQFNAAWDGTSNKLAATVAAGLRDLGEEFDPNDPEMAAEIAALEADIRSRVGKLAQKTGGIVNDALVAEATAGALDGNNSRAASAVKARGETLREYRTTFTKAELGKQINAGNLDIEQTATGSGRIVEKSSGLAVGRLRNVAGMDRQQQMQELGKLKGKAREEFVNKMGLKGDSKFVGIAKSDARAYLGEIKRQMKSPKTDLFMQTRKRKSPHAQAKKDGVDDAKAYGEGSREQSRKERRLQQKEEERDAKKLNRQANAQNRQRRAGKAFGVLGTATMVAGMASGMGGPVGEMAQQAMPVLGGLSAIGPLLMALPGPLALLAGGLGIAAFALFKWDESIKKSRKNGEDLANALTMTTSSLIAMSEITGTVTATEKRRAEQEAQLTGATAKQRKFGQQFLESEPGVKFLSSVKTAISSGLESAPGQIANQLATAVAEGALSSSQASSIVATLGAELGDFAMSGKISAQLISLIGPNGTDLTEDPLEVALKIQESSMNNMENMFNSLIDSSVKNPVAGVVASGTDTSYQLASGGGTSFTAVADSALIEDRVALESALVSLGINQVQQNQQLLDSVDSQYDKKKLLLEEELASTTDAEKKLEIEKQLNDLAVARKDAMAKMNAANATAFDDIVAMKSQLSEGVFEDALKATLDTRYADNEAMAVVVKELLSQLGNLDDKKFSAELQLQLASGELSPTAATKILEMKDTTVPLHFSFIADTMGVANASQLFQLLLSSGATNDQITRELIISANIKDPEEFDLRLGALTQLSQVPTEYGLTINVTGSNIDRVQETIAILSKEPDKITKERLLKLEEQNPGTFQGILDNWNTIVGDTDTITKEIIFDFKAVSSGGKDLIMRYMQATGAGSLMGDPSKLTTEQRDRLLATAVSYFIGGGKNTIVPNDPEDTGEGTGTGGGKKADPYADILSRLKQVRDGSINAAGGLEELRRVLGKTRKDMTKFSGTDTQLIFAGYSRPFIDAINSMDAETRSEFISITDGIVKVKNAGKDLNAAFAEQSIGDYVVGLQQGVANVNKQITAMTKLTAAGVNVSDAFSIAKDANLAYAISTATTSSEVLLLVEAFDKLQEAESRLSMSTPEGRSRELSSIIGEATSYFSAQEEYQNQQHEAGVKAYEQANEIVQAQRDLADKEYSLDDLQYALDTITEKETEINDAYDKREKAIEDIYAANQKIVSQDKEKLDVADALASGDLAAASKAMKAAQASAIENKKQEQLDSLKRSRELDLAQITDANGRSRLELEEDIRDVQKEIVVLQETKLEPYQKEIDRLDRIRVDALKDVSSTGFLGLTQSRWSSIANEVERAKFNVEGYSKALKDRLATIPGVTVGDDGSIAVDAGQVVAPAVSPAASSATGDPAKMTDTEKQIAELNRRITTTRWRVYNMDVDAAQKKAYLDLNIKRINEVRRLGGTPDMTGQTEPGTTTKFIDLAKGFAVGGVVPKYLASGGFAMGSDTVPAMLTPGEFVVRRHAVNNFGTDKLKAINSGTYSGDSVYNYSLSVNVKSDANPDQIARSVMSEIKRVDSQRIRGNRF